MASGKVEWAWFYENQTNVEKKWFEDAINSMTKTLLGRKPEALTESDRNKMREMVFGYARNNGLLDDAGKQAGSNRHKFYWKKGLKPWRDVEIALEKTIPNSPWQKQYNDWTTAKTNAKKDIQNLLGNEIYDKADLDNGDSATRKFVQKVFDRGGGAEAYANALNDVANEYRTTGKTLRESGHLNDKGERNAEFWTNNTPKSAAEVATINETKNKLYTEMAGSGIDVGSFSKDSSLAELQNIYDTKYVPAKKARDASDAAISAPTPNIDGGTTGSTTTPPGTPTTNTDPYAPGNLTSSLYNRQQIPLQDFNGQNGIDDNDRALWKQLNQKEDARLRMAKDIEGTIGKYRGTMEEALGKSEAAIPGMQEELRGALQKNYESTIPDYMRQKMEQGVAGGMLTAGGFQAGIGEELTRQQAAVDLQATQMGLGLQEQAQQNRLNFASSLGNMQAQAGANIAGEAYDQAGSMTQFLVDNYMNQLGYNAQMAALTKQLDAGRQSDQANMVFQGQQNMLERQAAWDRLQAGIAAQQAAANQKKQSGWGGALGGAVSGAAAGSAAGPWGALGGALIGGATGYFGTKGTPQGYTFDTQGAGTLGGMMGSSMGSAFSSRGGYSSYGGGLYSTNPNLNYNPYSWLR